jgi:hypothetical protein
MGRFQTDYPRQGAELDVQLPYGNYHMAMLVILQQYERKDRIVGLGFKSLYKG